MNWTLGPMVGLDFETTGVDARHDRMVTATVVTDIPGTDLVIRNWLVDPGVEIPQDASNLHGVSTEKARAEGMSPAVAIREITEEITRTWSPDVPLVIYNAPFDLTLWDAELERHYGKSVALMGPVLDPLTIDRGVDKYRKGKRTLKAACEHYGVELVNAHTSEADVVATLMIMRIMAERFPALGNADLVSLHKKQNTWYHNWALNFAGYLGRQASELSADEEDKLRRQVAELKASASHWPLVPRSTEGIF